MIAWWVGPTLASLGLLLLFLSQPIGSARPSLAERLQWLSPDRKPERASTKLFRLPGLDPVLEPALTRLGGLLLFLVRPLGIEEQATARRLRAAGEPYGPALLFGQKVAGLVVGFALPPLLGAAGLGPQSGWPPWAWLSAMAFGFFSPDIGLRARARARRRELLGGVAAASRLLTLALSAGYGLEQALVEVSSAAESPFFEELRVHISSARLNGRPAVEGMAELAHESEVPELEAFAGALISGARQGVPVLETLSAQATALRERFRLSLIESGERAAVVMLVPIGLLILPAFFLVVLYPAAVNLLQLSGL